MKLRLLIALFAFLFFAGSAQVVDHAKEMVDTLTAPYFWGRGYTHDGLSRASDYLVAQFKNIGLKPVKGKSYTQEFSYPVNTFPSTVEVEINGKKLTPGKDFIIGPESHGVKATGALLQKDSTHFVDAEHRIIVSLEDKLTWSVSPEEAEYTSILIDKKSLQEVPKLVRINLANKVIPKFKTNNVCGMIQGTRKPEKYIAMTAHYDHLGGMGDHTFFPGANDNASGIAMLLSLAEYYAKNPPPYSVIFICFSGEEAGLRGSKYFTENPLIDLGKISFLINLDLVGTGDDGITVVNASVYPAQFNELKKINDENKYFQNVKSRGRAANSDHYFFTEKGVPSFFIYTLGGIKAYHDVFDISQTLPFTEFNDLYNLIIKFNEELMR